MKTPVMSIVFVPTVTCNCTCDYCFQRLTGRTISDHDWGFLFSKFLELAEEFGCCTLKVHWQGGEVMCLGPDRVRKGLETASAVFSASGVTLEHHIQTNLLLYSTSEWRDLLRDNFLGNVSSSLDFPNIHRKTSSLSATEYTQTWLGKKELAENDGFTVSVISLPNSETLKLGAERFYRYYQDQVQVKNLQVNFPIPSSRNRVQSLPLDELAGFMIDLYDVWSDSGKELELSPYKALDERILNLRGATLCLWAPTCADSLIAVGPDGEVGQCDCWITSLNDFNFGSLNRDPVQTLMKSASRKLFVERPFKLIQNSECGDCHYWKICHGGCPVRAYTFSGEFFSPDHYCHVYRSIFAHILENTRCVNQMGLT